MVRLSLMYSTGQIAAFRTAAIPMRIPGVLARRSQPACVPRSPFSPCLCCHHLSTSVIGCEVRPEPRISQPMPRPLKRSSSPDVPSTSPSPFLEAIRARIAPVRRALDELAKYTADVKMREANRSSARLKVQALFTYLERERAAFQALPEKDMEAALSDLAAVNLHYADWFSQQLRKRRENMLAQRSAETPMISVTPLARFLTSELEWIEGEMKRWKRLPEDAALYQFGEHIQKCRSYALRLLRSLATSGAADELDQAERANTRTPKLCIKSASGFRLMRETDAWPVEKKKKENAGEIVSIGYNKRQGEAEIWCKFGQLVQQHADVFVFTPTFHREYRTSREEQIAAYYARLDSIDNVVRILSLFHFLRTHYLPDAVTRSLLTLAAIDYKPPISIKTRIILQQQGMMSRAEIRAENGEDEEEEDDEEEAVVQDRPEEDALRVAQASLLSMMGARNLLFCLECICASNSAKIVKGFGAFSASFRALMRQPHYLDTLQTADLMRLSIYIGQMELVDEQLERQIARRLVERLQIPSLAEPNQIHDRLDWFSTVELGGAADLDRPEPERKQFFLVQPQPVLALLLQSFCGLAPLRACRVHESAEHLYVSKDADADASLLRIARLVCAWMERFLSHGAEAPQQFARACGKKDDSLWKCRNDFTISLLHFNWALILLGLQRDAGTNKFLRTTLQWIDKHTKPDAKLQKLEWATEDGDESGNEATLWLPVKKIKQLQQIVQVLELEQRRKNEDSTSTANTLISSRMAEFLRAFRIRSATLAYTSKSQLQVTDELCKPEGECRFHRLDERDPIAQGNLLSERPAIQISSGEPYPVLLVPEFLTPQGELMDAAILDWGNGQTPNAQPYKVALEFDGAYHECKLRRKVLNPSTRLHRRVLRAAGWKVVAVSWRNWSQIGQGGSDRVKLLWDQIPERLLWKNRAKTEAENRQASEAERPQVRESN
jgi:hypothetical protein